MFPIATIAAGVNTVLIGKTHRPVDHSDLCNCDFDMSHSHSHFPPTRLPSHHGPSTQDARVYTAKKEKGSQAAVSSPFSQTLAEALPAAAELCLGEAPEISPPFRSPGHSLGGACDPGIFNVFYNCLRFWETLSQRNWAPPGGCFAVFSVPGKAVCGCLHHLCAGKETRQNHSHLTTASSSGEGRSQ